jgi:hypothetical protein
MTWPKHAFPSELNLYFYNAKVYISICFSIVQYTHPSRNMSGNLLKLAMDLGGKSTRREAPGDIFSRRTGKRANLERDSSHDALSIWLKNSNFQSLVATQLLKPKSPQLQQITHKLHL